MRRWASRAVAVLVSWGMVLGYAALADRPAHPVAVGVAVLTLFTVGWLGADAFARLETPRWQLYRAARPWRSYDPRFARLTQQIADAADRDAAAAAVHASLTGITERLLLDRYDVDAATDPETARRILGEPLASYLETGPEPGTRLVSPRLSAALDRLESL